MTATVYYVILGILAIIVIVTAMYSGLLRDTVNQQNLMANAQALNITNPKAPYSLGRSQLAFWTVIIISSFVYLLFRYKFEIPELNNVNLILLGIAATTTAVTTAIDSSQKQNPDRSQDYPSKGFFIDILSDKKGVSIHRLQNVLWTLVVGIIYVHCVAAEFRLPDETVLTTQLLTLMGISTGAYVGLKAGENSQ